MWREGAYLSVLKMDKNGDCVRVIGEALAMMEVGKNDGSVPSVLGVGKEGRFFLMEHCGESFNSKRAPTKDIAVLPLIHTLTVLRGMRMCHRDVMERNILFRRMEGEKDGRKVMVERGCVMSGLVVNVPLSQELLVKTSENISYRIVRCDFGTAVCV
jgi:hypothetical protein